MAKKMGTYDRAVRDLQAIRLETIARSTNVVARLVADDRCHLEAVNGRLLVRPSEVLAGMIEVHGLGLRGLPYEPVAVVSSVIELGAISAARMPELSEQWADLEGVRLPRLAVAAGEDPLPMVLAYLESTAIPS